MLARFLPVRSARGSLPADDRHPQRGAVEAELVEREARRSGSTATSARSVVACGGCGFWLSDASSATAGNDERADERRAPARVAGEVAHVFGRDRPDPVAGQERQRARDQAAALAVPRRSGAARAHRSSSSAALERVRPDHEQDCDQRRSPRRGSRSRRAGDRATRRPTALPPHANGVRRTRWAIRANVWWKSSRLRAARREHLEQRRHAGRAASTARIVKSRPRRERRIGNEHRDERARRDHAQRAASATTATAINERGDDAVREPDERAAERDQRRERRDADERRGEHAGHELAPRRAAGLRAAADRASRRCRSRGSAGSSSRASRCRTRRPRGRARSRRPRAAASDEKPHEREHVGADRADARTAPRPGRCRRPLRSSRSFSRTNVPTTTVPAARPARRRARRTRLPACPRRAARRAARPTRCGPLTITATWSHMRSTSSITWLENTIVPPPPVKCSSTERIARADTGSMASNGSSRKSSARAVQQRRGEHQLLAHAVAVVDHQRVGRVGEAEQVEQLVGAARRSRRPACCATARGTRAARGPRSRSKSARSSGSTPMRAFAAIGSVHTSMPSTHTCPRSGRSSPVAMRSVVVLPAPLGPTMPKNDPRGTSRLTLGHRDLRAERLRRARAP